MRTLLASFFLIGLAGCGSLSDESAAKMLQANDAMAAEHATQNQAFEVTLQRSVAATPAVDRMNAELKAQKIYRELDRSRVRFAALHAAMASAIRALASVDTEAAMNQALDLYNTYRANKDGTQ